MKFVLSRYNHAVSWVKDYTDDVVIYDRSEAPLEGSIVVPNIGSDIYDKLTYIIDNYDNLPDVALYSKANLFDYIRPKEFEALKDNKTFTPLFSQFHKEVMCDDKMLIAVNATAPKPFSYYQDGMYYELNYPSFLKMHPLKNQPEFPTIEWYRSLELPRLLGIDQMEYIPFAPGSGYILTRENIRQNSIEFYKELRSFIGWKEGYSGEDMILERGLYTIFKPRYN